MITCKGCGQEKKHKAKGLCQRCYECIKRNRKKGILCQCGKEAFKQGLCVDCYQTSLREIEFEDRMIMITCKGCGELKKHKAKGLCQNCYELLKQNRRKGKICKSCGNTAFRRGYCLDCYQAILREIEFMDLTAGY